MQIEVYGYSDDLIEVSGDISAEEPAHTHGDDEVPQLVCVSDGTVLSVTYGQDGTACWRIVPLVKGTAAYTKTEGVEDDDYTDRVTLTGDDVRWVVLNNYLYRARKG